ncbi:MAG: DNA-formamidopyrimidine glycosylase family protein [Actinomycetota bacterium]
MPELPEVRAHAERLTEWFGGASLRRLDALSFTALKTFDPRPDALHGRTLDRVDQRGKYLLLRFDDLTAVVHLMQGGRLRDDPKQSKKPRGGLVRFSFEDGRALLLSEAGKEHRAGVWIVTGDVEQQAPVTGLGPEADQVTEDELLTLLHAENKRLHGWLRDQRNLAGIGRRLANEVCYEARLSPFAMTRKLDAAAAATLVAAMRATIDEGMEFERGLDDMSASADRPGAVHHRIGEPCRDCDDTVRSVTYSGYTIAYCPELQTGGKVLADNTTSKFLK